MNYRPEIDGLRTVAVVPVVVYHLELPVGEGQLLPGGFLGVDVFFVISGFLITRIIVEELNRTSSFDIRRFYLRRARRLLPALLMVIAASIPAASTIMTPSEIDRFGESALAALGFVGNLYWFTALGEYGAQSGQLQPLLHTWSLAIEEQFYLFFPLLLLALGPSRRPIRAVVVLSALVVGSLLVAQSTTEFVKPFSFFSPLSRAWELLAGAVLALGLVYFPAVGRLGSRLGWLLPKVGLAVLLLVMFTMDLAAWAHPGTITLPAILATCAVIWGARPGEATTDLLSTPPFVFVGKLSYSLYLWHFPVFAFGRLALLREPGLLDAAIWTGLSLVLSVAGYYLVEQPLRHTVANRTFGLLVGPAVAALVVLLAVDSRSELLRSRRAEHLTALYGGDFFDNEALRDRSWTLLDELAGDETIGRWNAYRPSIHERQHLWFDDVEATAVLVVGDSHAKDTFNALHLADLDGIEVARFGMDNRFPQSQRAELFGSPNFAAADVVLIAPSYQPASLNELPGLVNDLRARGKTVAVAGHTPEFVSPGRLPLFDHFVRKWNGSADLRELNSLAFDARDREVAEMNRRLRLVAELNGATYLSRHDLVCDRARRTCSLLTPDGQKAMYDGGHWTLEGAAAIGRRVADTNWLTLPTTAE